MARAFKTGITADGDVSLTGKLFVNASGGDEGGEIFLKKPDTGTSISGGVNIDVYQNRLRIWEDSGTNRGVYIDMTTAGAGVGTNLLGTATDTNYYPSAIVFNAGTTAGPTLDLTMSGSGAPDLTAVAIPSASGTASGIVTTGTQTFAGTKTFSSTITADISGNSGTVTNGVYTTGDQTVGGAKTFSSPITSTHTGTWSSANITLQGNEPNIRFAETGQPDANIGTNSGNFYILGDTDSSGVYDTTPFYVNLTSGDTTVAGTLTSSNSTNWDTAYTDRLKWDGGSTGLTASTGRTSLGATTVGSNLFTLANPSAISWPRINADNTVTARSAANTRTDLGLGTMATETATNYALKSGTTFSGNVTMQGNSTVIGTYAGGAPLTTIYGGLTVSTSVSGLGNIFAEGDIDTNSTVYGGTGVNSGAAITALTNIYAGNVISLDGKSGTVTSQDAGYYFSASGYILAARTGGIPMYSHRYGASGTSAMFQFIYNGTNSGAINTTSGGTPAFASGSDYRMKTDVTPITDAIERMKSAKAYTFYKIDDIDPTDTLHTGFLAHELADVQADAVVGEKDAVDENGDPIYQEVMEAKIIPVMAQAINDLIGMVEALTARVELLENK